MALPPSLSQAAIGRIITSRVYPKIKAMTLPSIRDSREARVDRFQFSPSTRAKILSKKRCYILGMGPSIAKLDPSGFKDEVLIGVNRILRTAFRPDMVCVSDPLRLDLPNLAQTPKLITVRHIAERYAEQLAPLPSGIVHADIDVQFPLSQTWETVDRLDPHLSRTWWGGAVITDLAIPLAVYLGFEEINILGLDEISRSFPSSHVTGNEASPQTDGPDPGLVTHMQERMAVLARKENAKIYNLSTGGFCFAFPRRSLLTALPQALNQSFSGDTVGKFIVIGGEVAQIKPSGLGPNSVSLITAKDKRLRHHQNFLRYDANSDSEQLKRDGSFTIEAGFTRSDWISLRSVNMPERYVTAVSAPERYRLRPLSWGFSPYFSSFRLFDSAEEATARLEMEKLLLQANQQIALIGRMLLADDAR